MITRLTSRDERISGIPGVSCTHFDGEDCRGCEGNCSFGCKWNDAVWEKLASYEDMEEQHRLIELPCAIGSTIYIIVTKRPRISLPEFSFVKKSKLTWNNMQRVINEFGKTVFLREEEAVEVMESCNGEREQFK